MIEFEESTSTKVSIVTVETSIILRK